MRMKVDLWCDPEWVDISSHVSRCDTARAAERIGPGAWVYSSTILVVVDNDPVLLRLVREFGFKRPGQTRLRVTEQGVPVKYAIDQMDVGIGYEGSISFRGFETRFRGFETPC